MLTRIIGFIPHNNKINYVNVFGYSTNGIPGIEIIGLGKLSRPIKEKFYYLTKLSGAKLPLKRYVLCVEVRDLPKDQHSLRWLELPLLTVFWSMAKILPIQRLHDCVASGRVGIDEVVEIFNLNSEHVHEKGKRFQEHWKYLSLSSWVKTNSMQRMPIEEIYSRTNLKLIMS